jgi:hypothetical protein
LEPEAVDRIFQMQPIGPMDILFSRDNQFADWRQNILHNYRKGRQACLDGGYHGLFVVESDMIPPVDALVKLTSLDVDVALGYYLFRRSNSCTPNVGVDYDAIRAHWGEPLHGVGEGLGCALIKRPVLQAIDFRDGGHLPCDTPFFEDVRRAGHEIATHLGVRCGHKRPDGKILWPDREYGMTVSVGQKSDWHMKEESWNG